MPLDLPDPLPTHGRELLRALVLAHSAGKIDVAGRDLNLLHALHAERKLPLSYGTLYCTLRQLAESGHVTFRDETDEDGRVRFFAITDSGRGVLACPAPRVSPPSIFAGLLPAPSA